MKNHNCPVCGRLICLTLTDKLVRHKQPDDIGHNWTDYCGGSGMAIEQDLSPATVAFLSDVQAVTGVNLADWWVGISTEELPGLLAKVEEYSSYDLEMVGRMIADTIGINGVRATVGFYAELGCWFYLLGKIARAMGAIRDGKLPSRDTALDTRIYATMILRIKEAGGWPG